MYDFLRSALFRLDPEQAHSVAMAAARLSVLTRTDSLVESSLEYEHGRIRQEIWGKIFPNPVGLAAGFDKNASLLDFWSTIGFGFVEVGSVTARPSKGNPRPRAFRLPEEGAIINRMGLNNKGAHKIAERLARANPRRDYVLGINLAKTHDSRILGESAVEDFRESFRLLAPYADYIALNVSCPNTSDGRTFEDPEALEQLLHGLREDRAVLDRPVPLVIKLSPPHSDRVVYDSDVEAIVDLSRRYGIDGFIATNTASDRENLETNGEQLAAIGSGGLSGRPLEARSTHLVRYLYRLTGGRVPIIGVGGIFSAEDAYRKVRAGASLVQLYTGLIYEGPMLIHEIKKGLVELLLRDGFERITDAIGEDA